MDGSCSGMVRDGDAHGRPADDNAEETTRDEGVEGFIVEGGSVGVGGIQLRVGRGDGVW